MFQANPACCNGLKNDLFCPVIQAAHVSIYVSCYWCLILVYIPLSFRFLGTSGQNIDDLKKYSEANDTLEFMERTLRWRHLAPTAPNTLGKI